MSDLDVAHCLDYLNRQDGDKFCWNDQCWISPIFVGYFKTGPYVSGGGSLGFEGSTTTQRVGYVNTFGRETVIDSALTSALQAPVKVSLATPSLQ